MENNTLLMFANMALQSLKNDNPEHAEIIDMIASGKELTVENLKEFILNKNPENKQELLRIFEDEKFKNELEKINNIRNYQCL